MSTQEIENLEAELAKAMLGNDVAMLDRLLSDDLVFSDPDGVIVNKAQDLALHQSGDTIFTTYEIGEFLIQSYEPILSYADATLERRRLLSKLWDKYNGGFFTSPPEVLQ